MNPLAELAAYGQSFWLDYMRRSFVEDGGLQAMIERDGLRGLTSNPAIFQKAIAESTDYAGELDALRAARGRPKEIFEQLARRDILRAADLLRPVYDRTENQDGYVSLEVDPELARDTRATLHEARRLWRQIGRPNLMIKVPATEEGLPAIEALLSEGVNVNITLLFSVSVYERVARIYLRALGERAQRGQDVKAVASVASFFVSRIDTAVDAMLEQKMRAASPAERPGLRALLGKAAIANAKRAHRRYRDIFSGAEWEKLQALGARPQRLLWASTSTKNPAYRDVMYVEELIGEETVNTMPPQTADAFRDHGRLRHSLAEDPESSERALLGLEALGISLDAVTTRLLREGVESFAASFRSLIETVSEAVTTTG
ncbi:MAG: transaldolase [Bryobacterales bacterium]|nr:transaldolase [Bryobacterales bacterium]